MFANLPPDAAIVSKPSWTKHNTMPGTPITNGAMRAPSGYWNANAVIEQNKISNSPVSHVLNLFTGWPRRG